MIFGTLRSHCGSPPGQPKEVSVRAGHTSVSFTLDRYGHLFPGHDAELRDRLDAMHVEGLKGTAGGCFSSFGRRPRRPGRPVDSVGRLGAFPAAPVS
jgi:hypothetical protein